MRLFEKSKVNLLGFHSETHKDWRVKPLTLKFTGEQAGMEKEFLDDYFTRSIGPMRFSLVLAIFFYCIFAVLDAMIFPELKHLFWFIRFGVVTPALIAVILFSLSSRFKKYMQEILAGIMYITGLGIIIMSVFAANMADDYSYYAGLILIFIFGYTFIRARFVYASIAGWSIVASYEIAAITMSDTPFEILINNNYFFVSANVIGMFISYFMEHSARRDFYMRKLLQTEQNKVQAANNALEKRVEERTKQLTVANKDLKKEIEVRKHHQKEKDKL